MLFLSNNPVYIIIGVFVIGFFSYMVYKIILEIKLNNLLKLKQSQMRVFTKNRSFTKRIGLLSWAALTPLLLFALILSFNTSDPIPFNELQAISNSQDILEIHREYARYKNNQNGWDESFDAVEENPPVIEEQEVGQDDQASDDYSEVNVQVSGIDEMDNVITDGKYIYQIRHSQVNITLAYTKGLESNALSQYKVINYLDEDATCPSGMRVSGLYVDDDYLVVIGSKYQYTCNVEVDDDSILPTYFDYWHAYNKVNVLVYDKNDDFSLVNEYELSGNLVGTRKIDDNIFVITNQYIPFYEEDINLDDYLSHYKINDSKTTITYDEISYVKGTNPNSFTNFFAIDLDNNSIDMEVVLGDNGYNLYVSHNNIYLVGNIYDYRQVSITPTSDDDSQVKTAIQKISINDADLKFEAIATIPGYTLNQFSMDESNGYLRIATTTGWWGPDINNRVFILNENLEEISRLENLGKPGETIRSVRFVGDYGYVVTFEQTDPFYIINLSDPENPAIEGVLEIPGFSTYLQALNDNYMLGIGFGDSQGGTNGLKISIYDISIKSEPNVFSEVIIDYSQFGWSSSSAIYNHKDLLVSLSKGLIALPFSTTERDDNYDYRYKSGVLVYHFDETDGLTKAGFISHDQDAETEAYVYKILFIDDILYTISDQYIKSSLISDPELIINSVDLPEVQYPSNDGVFID